MELRHLRYFVAVAHEGHITRAAERLHIAQPPLSQQIKGLEREIGAALFVRHPRGVTLTDAGRAFLVDAEAVLASVARAADHARRTARGESGRIAVGFTTSAPFHPLVARAIREFRTSRPNVSFVLEESSSGDLVATRAAWPHAFALELTVTVTRETLTLALAATNPGPAPFAFTGALHTYLAVADIAATVVRGLTGARYRDKVMKHDDVAETAAALAIDRPLDRVYHAAPESLLVTEPQRALAIRAEGFPDTVIWNPGPARGPAPPGPPPDLEPDAYRRMLCVEAAVARAPVVLAPQATWRGTQTLRVA